MPAAVVNSLSVKVGSSQLCSNRYLMPEVTACMMHSPAFVIHTHVLFQVIPWLWMLALSFIISSSSDIMYHSLVTVTMATASWIVSRIDGWVRRDTTGKVS